MTPRSLATHSIAAFGGATFAIAVIERSALAWCVLLAVGVVCVSVMRDG